MNEINWSRFELKNPNPQNAFETMCRNIFLRTYKVSSHGFSANYNQAGLETEPILFDGKYYGFQCKYSASGNGDALYAEVLKSLKKAVVAYPHLNTAIIYTNLDIKPNVSQEDLQKTRKSNRVKIYELGQANNLEILWFVKPNFEKALNEVGNYDLYRSFFSPQDIHGFLSNILSHDERTFLVSNQFVDLPLNGARFSNIKEEILEQKTSIITGAAGTGKSEILKSIYLQCETEYLTNATQVPSKADVAIPVFIRLRECVNGNLEELLRQRLKDFEISIENAKNSYVYFFDGLDEVNTFDFNGVLTCVLRLTNKASTKSIILASRINSANLTSVIRSLQPKIYTVDPLKISDVEDYYRRLNNPDKSKQLQQIKTNNPSFFDDITDIFSAVLLSEHAFEIDNTSTKVDLIRLNAEKLIENNRKYSIVNLPEPKIKSVERILGQVSKSMQRTGNISVSRFDLQEIIKGTFPTCSYLQVDEIIDFIAEMFFDSAPTHLSQKRYSYRHKRYFEFYLYNAIKSEFYDNPAILRELKLLSNKDFILNIFLIQELKNNILANNIQHVLMLRFFEDYLGEDYVRDADSPWFMLKSSYVPSSDSYLESKQLKEYLCTKHIDDLRDFLKTDPLSIKGFLQCDGYYAFVKQYHKANGIDIRPLLKEIYAIENEWEDKAAINDLGSYFYCRCIIEGVSIEDIFITIGTGENIHPNDLDHYPYGKNETNIIVQFFELAIDSLGDWLASAVQNISVQQLEVLSYLLLRPQYIGNIVIHDTDFSPVALAIKERVSNSEEDQHGIHTIALYGILTGTLIHTHTFAERVHKVNKNHYGTWHTNFELNSYVGMLLKEEFHAVHYDYKLGIALRRIVHDYYPNKKQEVLPMILQEVNKYNLVCKNWFSYCNAVFIGEVIASLDIDNSDKKRFLIQLRKFGSVVSTFQVLYTVMKRSIELFKIIANPSLIASEYSKASQVLSYYDYNSDLAFMYATMISHFDIVKGDALFEDAINNSIFRPNFRKESMLDYHLPNSLLTAYNNCWLTTEELELMITRVECILRIAADTLDSGAYREYFKYLVEQCCPHLADLLQEMGERAENPEKTYGWESFSSKVCTENISPDNLQQYYSCEISGINYSSFSVWKALIQFELINDKELTLLYQTLEKHYFPSSNYSRMNHCFHIIIAVLISDSKTKPKAIGFLMNHAGRSGLIILIRAFALIGEDQQGRQSVEQLVRLCEAMVYPSSEYIGKATLPSNRNWKIISSVCNSTISDWNRESEDNIMHFLPDSKIAIKWDCYEDQEPFFEEWATKHPDKNAYITKYYICYEEEIIKVFGMVYVDGRRALIPLPSLRTNHIDRASYNFACLVNSDVGTLNSYICRSGLIVD